jgi:hypothetical protein
MHPRGIIPAMQALDPLLPFKFPRMDGRNAQEPVIRRRLRERAISTQSLLSIMIAANGQPMRQSKAIGDKH